MFIFAACFIGYQVDRSYMCVEALHETPSNHDTTAIPVKKSLSRELLHIDTFNLASPHEHPASFRPALSVPVFWFVHDSWGSNSMRPQATMTQPLYRSRNP
jgi:hypothetical protein